jgi:2-amino-4-hydroxy-6-hydroxymethyldihydropteridine diphosphokinase
VPHPVNSRNGHVKAWIGLGGNHGETALLMKRALDILEEHDEISVLRVSGMYQSPPWGVTGQPDFVNAVAELDTSLQADELLTVLLQIESHLGRERSGPRWGPRCIDLDLLTYQDLVVSSSHLELPHPRMHLRAFVLVPVLELEPGFMIPGVGEARLELENLDLQEVTAVQPLVEAN